jgi:alkanesulfonate monooxygenase SsuD/methylene tetrahydromethanopterin reductase-like flavin-dependent oxidoreductase (luciferase family)
MRFSVAVPSMRIIDGRYTFDPDAFVNECRVAEEAGFDGAVVGERRIGVTAYCTSPNVLGGMVLANTERLTFSPMVVQLPLRNPIDVIQDATVLNSVYPGRYRLGVGAGYNEHEFHLLGVPMTRRGALMEEGLTLINRFRDGEMSVDLGRGTVPALDPALGPCRPEVWVGAWTRAGVERTARLADGWLVDPMRTITAIEELAEVYRHACEQVGKQPRIVLLREAWIGESDDEALRQYGPHLFGAHAEYFPRMRGGWTDESDAAGKPYDVTLDPWVAQMATKEDLDMRNLVDDRILVGSTQTWHDLLDDWSGRVGMEEVVLRLRFQGGPPPEATIEAIRQIGDSVIPRYRAAVST